MSETTGGTFKTRRELKKMAWSRLHVKGVYRKLLVLGLLPVVVNVVFWILAAISGLALSISRHHLEQAFRLGADFSDRFLWIVLNSLICSLVAVIVDYVALDRIRRKDEHFTVGDSLQRYLGWRYVLGFAATSIIKGFIFWILGILEVMFAVIAIFLYPHGPMVTLITLLVVIVCTCFTVFLALLWSQTRFVMKDAIESGHDWTIISLLRESQHLMRGFCTDLLQLYCSLIGWYLLELFTLGLASIFISPYVKLLEAAFYENVLQFDHLQRSLTSTN